MLKFSCGQILAMRFFPCILGYIGDAMTLCDQILAVRLLICLITNNYSRGQTLAVAVDLLTLPKFFMRPDIGGVLLPLHLRRRHNFMRPDIGDKTMSQWISKLSLGSRQPLINQSLCQEKLMHNSFTMYTHD